MLDKQVAIVVPVYQEQYTQEEVISLKHLFYFLGNVDKFIVCPESLNFCRIEGLNVDYLTEDYKLLRLNDRWFKSINSYNKLMMNEGFYGLFSGYDYVLIYQLDAIVFSGDIDRFCGGQYDYIGAPWFNKSENYNNDGIFWGVGNGGLSMRKVESFLRVLRSNVTRLEGRALSSRGLYLRNRFLDALGVEINIPMVMFDVGLAKKYPWLYSMHEDRFWGFIAPCIDDDFIVSNSKEALQFSFEVAPERCFEYNNNKLPFGAHAWNKISPQFWRPYLL